MKNILILLLSLAFIACSSSSDKIKTAANVPTHTLIFMDKSVSVNVNRAFVNQKYLRAINDIIEQNIYQKGDKIEVYFIHENTAKARALMLTVRTDMDDVSHASATDREAAKTSFDLALQREKGIFRQQIRAKLAEQNPSTSNQETDILASIPVIAKAAESGAAIHVYYLSDMIQSTKGQTGVASVARDFGKTPPSGRAQADEWAKADAELFRKYSLGNAAIMMILPFEPTSSVKENNPAVTQYWQALFDALGVGNVDEQ